MLVVEHQDVKVSALLAGQTLIHRLAGRIGGFDCRLPVQFVTLVFDLQREQQGISVTGLDANGLL